MPDSLDDIDSRIETFRERYLALNASIRQQAKNLDWATENTVVLEHGAMSVRRFHDNNGNTSPVLVVYSHVNSPHVIDLQEEVSLVRRLQECGNTVYLLDWGDISENDRENDLSVYVLDYVTAALEVIRSETGVFRPALLGVCQGGTFALCYACAFSDRIRRLALLVTPVDFHAGDSVLTQWSRFIDFKAIEKHPVNIPGAAITAMFQGIRPFSDLSRQISVIDSQAGRDELPLTTFMDQWVFACPDQPGRAFAQFCRMFYQENSLVEDQLVLAGNPISLSGLQVPVLNAYARKDHLVPAPSSAALAQHVDETLYDNAEFDGGHVGLMVSKKAQGTILTDIGSWLTGP